MITIIAVGVTTVEAIAICDHCGKRIGKAKEAKAIYRIDPNGKPTGSAAFTHAACYTTYTLAHDGPSSWTFVDLHAFIIDLARNLKIDVDEDTPELP